ncbi:hypothetical protein AKJ16_DCAP06992, partial [Drosera capensis]
MVGQHDEVVVVLYTRRRDQPPYDRTWFRFFFPTRKEAVDIRNFREGFVGVPRRTSYGLEELVMKASRRSKMDYKYIPWRCFWASPGNARSQNSRTN